MSGIKKCANKDHVGDPLLEATLENFYRDAKSSDGLSSWCKVCQNPPKEKSPKKDGEININQFMTNGKGHLVPIETVTEIDKTRDELVQKTAKNAQAIQKAMINFKTNSMSEIDAFVDISAQEYGVTFGGKKGNLTLYSYDMK